MKLRFLFNSLIIGGMLLINGSIFAQAKVDKKEAEIKKLETTMKTAQANLAKAQKAAHISDSLIETGTQMINEGKSESKQIDADRKKRDKEYATEKKPLEKKMGSKDKDEQTEAKNEIKQVDTKYKADVKEMDNKKKAAEKKIQTGTANLAKGKGSKKMNEAAVEKAQTTVDDTQAKLDAANGVEPEEPQGKKGKKK